MPHVTSRVSSMAVSYGVNFGLSKKCLGCCRCQSPPRSTTRSRATTWGSRGLERHSGVVCLSCLSGPKMQHWAGLSTPWENIRMDKLKQYAENQRIEYDSTRDRKRGVKGKSVSVSVDIGGG